VVELILTAVLVVCAVGLDQVGRRLKRDPDTLYELIAIALAFVVLIWAPAYLRSLLIGGFVMFAVYELGLGVIVIMLALVVASGLFLPGGVSVLLFAIVVYFGIAEIRSSRKHLTRIARAQALVANQPVEHEVEVAGTAHAVKRIVDPVYGAACAMWRVTGQGTRESNELVEVRGARGSAMVDPTTVSLQWSRGPKIVRDDEAKRAAETLQLELLEGGALMLYVLPEGGDCYVVGLPVWESAPAGTVGLYRDSPMLPTFRSTPEHPALFADRSETQLRADHTWALASWGTWGALCAAVAVMQLGGWA
jgi:hypothetical protein